MKRSLILLGMALGAVWAAAVVLLPGQAPQVFIPMNLALIYAFAPGGFVMLAMVAVLAVRRFFDGDLIDGQSFAPGSRAEIDQRVLTNTVEQMVLAFAIWPFVSSTIGVQTMIAMGIAFAVARVLFWVGYHIWPPLRAFGFAASFYPTVLAAIWALVLYF